MGIQQSQLSQVMAGKLDLNLDQGSRLCDDWQLSDSESEYFLNLIQFERASTSSLKARIRKRLEELHKSYSKEGIIHLEPSGKGAKEAERFFSSWIYPAVLGALYIPTLLGEDDIAKRLDTSSRLVRETLIALQEMNLVKMENGKYRLAEQGITHVSRSATGMMHAGLRSKAHEVYVTGDTEIIRFGTLNVLGRDHFLELRKRMQTFVEQYNKETTSVDHEHDELVVFNLDFFRIGRSSN